MKIYMFDYFDKCLNEQYDEVITFCFCKNGMSYFKTKIDDCRDGLTFFSNTNSFNSSFMKLFYPLTDSQKTKLKSRFNKDCGKIK